jgi:hypothetical protein
MVGNKSVRISRIDIKTELISDPQKNSDRLLYIYVQTPRISDESRDELQDESRGDP